MNPFHHIRDEVTGILDRLAAAGSLPADMDYSRISVEPTRDPSHGDIATNAAMVLAKTAGMKPRDLAEPVAAQLGGLDTVTKADVAGPGFINVTLADEFWRQRLIEILTQGPRYGDSALGQGETINVEYVSANPTGPMHVGHGRGAVVGDALAALLEKAGYDVCREYYINDAGAQVDALARSLHWRYREALGGEMGDMPDDLYPGDYLVPVAKSLAERDGDKWAEAPEEDWLGGFRELAIDAMMALIREDLSALGIAHDLYRSERSLVNDGKVDAVLANLEGRDLVYTGTLDPPKGQVIEDWEPRPQLLFRATQFGDDVDRPLKKSDDSWTYFATDMAYHLDKFERGFGTMIDVWGADHGGYVKRVDSAVKALTEEKGRLDVKLCQMVNLMENGEPVKMSKRAGTFITLREVIDRVGKDVVRFIMLTRKNDAALDFDFAAVTEQSRDNPVFYVQYSHARCHSVLRHAAEMFTAEELSPSALAKASLDKLSDESELALIKQMAAWPSVVEGAALAHEPHRVAYYLHEVSALFHSLWTKGSRSEANLRFINTDDKPLTLARLALVQSLAFVIASGLEVMGVTPVEEL